MLCCHPIHLVLQNSKVWRWKHTCVHRYRDYEFCYRFKIGQIWVVTFRVEAVSVEPTSVLWISEANVRVLDVRTMPVDPATCLHYWNLTKSKWIPVYELLRQRATSVVEPLPDLFSMSYLIVIIFSRSLQNILVICNVQIPATTYKTNACS